MPKGLTDNLQNLISTRNEPTAESRQAAKDAKKVTYRDVEIVKAGRKENEEMVQNYALRLPKDFYKALRLYCEDKGITMNTFIYSKLKESVENDPDFRRAFEYVNKK